MVIDKVHGLQATGLSLNDRFTMLSEAPDPRPRPQRRTPFGLFNQNGTFRNKNFIEQIARRLAQQKKRQALHQRIGVGRGGLRRFGSESSLPALRRFNSFGNLNYGLRSRLNWRQSNGNLNRSASFGNLSQGTWRGRALRPQRRRGGRVLRPRPRVGEGFRMNNAGRARGGARGAARGVARGGARRGRGLGRAGIFRTQNKPVPTKEELDLQLDQYMAGSKYALDAELDDYMKNAMDLE